MAEIAGLVLGAIPLLIAALEYYETATDKLERFYHWRGQQSMIIRRLGLVSTAYDQNVHLMLMGTGSNDDLSEMIRNAQSHLWRADTLAEDLQSKLGLAYAPTMSTIGEINDIMIRIAADLNIDGADQVTHQGLDAVISANPPQSTSTKPRERFQFRKRVKFTMKRRMIIDQLEKLDECNTRLERFLERAIKIQDSSQSDDSIPPVRIQFKAPLGSIQKNASRVHRVLQQSWCTNHESDSHLAGLLLEQRLVRRRKKDPSEPRDANCFGVSLRKASNLMWLDTELHVDDLLSPMTSVPSIPRVTFVEPQRKEGSSELGALEITDICSTISSAVHPMVGLSLDSEDKLRGLYEIQSQQSQLADNAITLAEFLPTMSLQDFPLRDRYALAITLVCSILQLGQTPWLLQSWSKQTVVFLRLKDDGERKVDVQHPYLTSKHEQTFANDPRTQVRQPAWLNMLALGIMLLEIYYGTPIESVRQSEDLGSDGLPNMGTDLTAAKRWLDRQRNLGNLTSALRNSVSYCLHCFFDSTVSFSDPDFLDTVQKNVLVPLEREMQQLLHGS